MASNLASMAPPSNDKKRVKVYELKNNDWFDRGTGFCSGRVVNVRVPNLNLIYLLGTHPFNNTDDGLETRLVC